MQKLLNVEEFAAGAGWKPATVRQKVWKREIEFVRMGRNIRFKPETLHRMIEENTIPARGESPQNSPHRPGNGN